MSTTTTRPSLDKIIATINKKLGPGTVVKASDATAPIPRIPSGSVTLDYILGGGWPANQWVELIGEASSGKALDISTPIPSPDGWTTMEKLQPGDRVFDERGEPCRVTFATEVQHDRTCYAVKFSDGSSLIADADHQWTLIEKADGGRLKQHTVTTQYMVDKGVRANGDHHWRFRIPTAEPLQYMGGDDLPVDPYVLGVWLGDGHTGDGAITSADEEVVRQVALHYEVSKRKHFGTGAADSYGVLGLKADLRKAGVLGDKHIPEEYLAATVDDRLALLQGLMDSDGSVNQKGSCEFTSIKKGLTEQVVTLLRSLGIAPTMGEGDARLDGRWISKKYRVLFRTELPAFRLSRKAVRQASITDSKRTYLMRRVVSLEPVESRPVKCVQVDSDNSLYLAGDACIPTHNTGLALKTVAANQQRDPDHTTVWIAAEKWVSQYAEMCGVDCDRVYVVESNVMEGALDAAISFAESRQVDLIVIDSLPALVPSAEDEKIMEEMTVGRHALLVNKFFRKVGYATKRSLVEDERPVCGIVINQWRAKIDGSKYDTRTTPGGQGKDYSFFVRAEVRRSGWIDVGSGVETRRIGQTVRIRTLKNKTSPAQQVCEFDFYYDDGGEVAKGEIDFGKELVTLGVITKVIERKGSWMYYKERKWQGAESMLESIREEIDLAEDLRSEIIALVSRP